MGTCLGFVNMLVKYGCNMQPDNSTQYCYLLNYSKEFDKRGKLQPLNFKAERFGHTFSFYGEDINN